MFNQPTEVTQAPALFAFARCVDLPRYLHAADPTTIGLVATSMMQELTRLGWAESEPGDTAGRMLTFQGLSINVDRSIQDLAAGRLPADRWVEASNACGIAGVPIAVPASGAALTAAFVAVPMYDRSAATAGPASWPAASQPKERSWILIGGRSSSRSFSPWL
jgi:hypothetical protein